MQIIFSFWSFEISVAILKIQKKVQVGNGQEKAQSEKIPTPKKRDGKN